MKFDVAAVRNCLKSFDFQTLFREHLGWDNYHAQLDVPVGENTFHLTAVAQKRGFVAFVCPSIPDRATRLKIDHHVTKSVREHFVIYFDKAAGQQVWQWVRREPGKPLASREYRFHVSQSGDPLIQRLNQIAVSIEEEEQITVVDVANRARAAFDVDKVTKKFYDRFKAEHADFLKLIKGIKYEEDLQWYTSLMLNRLMFVYFIQKKGFLDGDTDYLRNRLKRVQEIKGKGKFHTFYRYFLLRLFHEGLGKSPEERKLDPDFERLLGKVPFLDGGFFEVHELEQRWEEIDIPDEAFEKLFDFFDQYRWHLDERPLRADNEINPDVVGYIFEKYVNQKQMGAYYTKEDITEYISKNTIIPFLFDAARKKCPIAFKPDSAVWRLLREDPDRYIYPAVRHGVIRPDGSVVPESDLPEFVQKGMHDPNARMFDKRYNLEQAPAGDPIRLVTETWREYVYRRNRCLEIREKLQKGEIHEINDLITLNLDIWQFARDAIVNCEDPELLRAFWHAVEKITVLDPTCGSGAFLFAALRILETLYGDCLERMERFVEDLAGKKHPPEQFSDFKEVLERVAEHPNERYFILKSIIINNLFGVDIMEEAVEICKLRLFLKLAAQVEKIDQIEPLPDIDFNIRAGNTLVGFASLEQVRKSQEGRLGFAAEEARRIEEEAELVERAFQQFRAQQTTHGGRVTHRDKQQLRRRLEKLTDKLDRFLAGEYGVNLDKPEEFEAWKASHQPFHWFAEFYGIMRNGGFDVIIGNPPYVEYSQRSVGYRVLENEYLTFSSRNLYAFVYERSKHLDHSHARLGIIVQISSVSTPQMRTMAFEIRHGQNFVWVSNYATRPSCLFEGVTMNLTILLSKTGVAEQDTPNHLWSTKYIRWNPESRHIVFPTITYVDVPPDVYLFDFAVPKLTSACEITMLRRLLRERQTLEALLEISKARTSQCLHYRTAGGRYFKIFSDRPLGTESTSNKRKFLKEEYNARAAIAVLSSSLWWWYYTLHFDMYNCKDYMIYGFRFDFNKSGAAQELAELGSALVESLFKNAKRKTQQYATTGARRQLLFRPSASKAIIDEIDKVLAKHYGFTDEELDFIINYDIKYRMGDDAGVDEE
ncbi:MAG TPA: hypothetical protein PKI05_02230 [Thermogutta sp.]|nr:hypothetical protein [Thermogutta sp.]HOP77380.1 hypothetical protein [Thermogutta sp.]HPU06922.1 hypothetical protein [Thermogutta sp.]